MTQPSEKLFEEVRADARTKADRARRRGRREAEEIRKRAAEEAEAGAGRIRSEGRAQAETRRDQVLATLQIEAQRRRLALTEEHLQAAYDRVLEKLRGLDAETLDRSRLALGLEGLEQMPPGEVEVALPADRHAAEAGEFARRLAEAAADRLGRNVTIRPADEPAEADEGFLLRSADGRVEVAQSLRQRLRRLWPELRVEVARELFPELMQSEEA